jgi:DNA-binding NarL/FixJ family response regulator
VTGVRVLIADDDDLMRAGLAELLTADPTIEIAGRAATGRQAIDEARRVEPDVILMDVRMPDLDGIAATRALTTSGPGAGTGGPRILILTTFEDDDYIFGALRAGASGFLLKRTRPEDLISAVHTIASGDSLLSPSITRRVIDHMARQPAAATVDPSLADSLTPREREVLVQVARGLANREIADLLVVEESTIKSHVKHILMKLGLRDRVQAVIYAYETGLNHTTAADPTEPIRSSRRPPQ